MVRNQGSGKHTRKLFFPLRRYIFKVQKRWKKRTFSVHLRKSFAQEYRYHDMHSPMLEDPDFDGKPLVMLIGQYSTGKTTFIRCHFFRR